MTGSVQHFSPGETAVHMVLNGITSRDILTPEAIRNAIMVLMATGGSTNCVIHTLAIAHEIGLVPKPSWDG